jgi:hypothetical protein
MSSRTPLPSTSGPAIVSSRFNVGIAALFSAAKMAEPIDVGPVAPLDVPELDVVDDKPLEVDEVELVVPEVPPLLLELELVLEADSVGAGAVELPEQAVAKHTIQGNANLMRFIRIKATFCLIVEKASLSTQ